MLFGLVSLKIIYMKKRDKDYNMEEKMINLEIPISELNRLFAVLAEQKSVYEQKYSQVNSLITLLQKQSVPQISDIANSENV